MKLNAIAILFTFDSILFIVPALGTIVIIPVALKYIGLSEAADLLSGQRSRSQPSLWPTRCSDLPTRLG